MESGTDRSAQPEGTTGQKQISMEAEFKEWGSKTTFGLLAGMLYGGTKEALGSAHYGEVLAPMQDGKDLKTKRFMWRELMEQRVLRIARGTVLGGARLGTFTAIFCGIQGYMAVERNVHDTLNVVAAGSATAAAFGLAMPGSFLSRIRAASVGSLLGATLCFPLGYLQTTLQEQAEDADNAQNAKELASTPVGEMDGISATIRRLERSLSESEAITKEKQ
ncbi:unnamed protein product [Calypogeia fissa]